MMVRQQNWILKKSKTDILLNKSMKYKINNIY